MNLADTSAARGGGRAAWLRDDDPTSCAGGARCHSVSPQGSAPAVRCAARRRGARRVSRVRAGPTKPSASSSSTRPTRSRARRRCHPRPAPPLVPRRGRRRRRRRRRDAPSPVPRHRRFDGEERAEGAADRAGLDAGGRSRRPRAVALVPRRGRRRRRRRRRDAPSPVPRHRRFDGEERAEGAADRAGLASGQHRRRSRMSTDLPGYCFSVVPARSCGATCARSSTRRSNPQTAPGPRLALRRDRPTAVLEDRELISRT